MTTDIEAPRVLQSTEKETTIAADGTSITTTTKFFSDGTKEVEKVSTAAPTESTRVAKTMGSDETTISTVATPMVVSAPSATTKAPSGSTSPDSRKEGNCMATAGMICGIVSLFFFGFVLGILAIIFSSCALSQLKKEPERFDENAKCKATTGLVTGIIGLCVWVVLVIVYI